MKKPSKLASPHKGIYLLPNLLTTAALFAGFYAIVAAMKGHFDIAAIAIFTAMVMDMLDGRVARLTGTVSEFGAEYDSLSDLVAFGVAPALVLYSWGLQELGKLGWLVAFIHTATMALRLARFNTQQDTADKRFFTGLPAPAAAGTVVGFVWMIQDLGMASGSIKIFAAGITATVSALMVSTIPYYSFKDIDLRGKVPFVAILMIVLIFVGISVDPPKILFGGFFLFACSGPVGYFLKYKPAHLPKSE